MTMQQIITDAFADLNAQMLSRQLAWAEARLADTKAVIAELAPKRRQMGEWAYYDAVFAAAGGKTWFNMIFGDLVGNVTKNIANIIAKRDAKIILAIGRKLPRWPECHVPAWLEGMTKEEREAKVQMPILGNFKVLKEISKGYNAVPTPQAPASPFPNGLNEPQSDDLPF